MRLAAPWFLLAAMGCSEPAAQTVTGDDDDSVTAPGDDDDDDNNNNEIPTFDTTVDTGGGSDTASGTTPPTYVIPPNPQTMSLGYTFGWDPVTRTTSEVTITIGANSTVIVPAIEINIGDDTWTGDLALTNNYCSVFLPLYNAPEDAAFEAIDPRHWQALTYDPILDLGTTDCFDGVGLDLDPYLWGTGLALYLGNLGPWSVAVGEPEAYTLSILTPYLTLDVLPEHLLGGTLRDAAYIGVDIPEIYGFAWQVDSTFDAILLDQVSLVPIRLDQVPSDDTVRQAWYDMNSLFLWTFN